MNPVSGVLVLRTVTEHFIHVAQEALMCKSSGRLGCSVDSHSTLLCFELLQCADVT